MHNELTVWYCCIYIYNYLNLLWMQARSDSQLHPDWKQSVHFVCTSLEQWSPECRWDDPNYYTQQAILEVRIAKQWVIRCIRNWPTVEWGEVDPSSLCVIVANRLVVSRKSVTVVMNVFGCLLCATQY